MSDNVERLFKELFGNCGPDVESLCESIASLRKQRLAFMERRSRVLDDVEHIKTDHKPEHEYYISRRGRFSGVENVFGISVDQSEIIAIFEVRAERMNGEINKITEQIRQRVNELNDIVKRGDENAAKTS